MWKVVLGTIGFVIPVTVTFIDVVGYVARVEGASMQPTLNPKDTHRKVDYVYLSRWDTHAFDVSRGDIVSLTSPIHPPQKMIKRIVALEGDIIRTLNYRERYVKIPIGHCWIEGDNHKHSMDSNYFGPVALGLINSKAKCIVWPPSRLQTIKSDPHMKRGKIL